MADYPVYKLIALDMDGVVNSSTLIRTWINNKYEELSYVDDPIQRKRLARESYMKEFSNCYEAVFPELAEKITRICNEADAYILWSSTWRNTLVYSDIEVAKEMFNRRGLPGDRIIGYTPDFGGDKYRLPRGSEIKHWLNNRVWNADSPVRCAVLDDRVDAGEDIPECAKLFLTDDSVGITDEIADEVISYLKG